MTTVALFFVLLKATVLSFSGFGSLPQVREDLVVRLHVLTDDELNRSILVARTTPGPMGTYVVVVGYQVSGVRGAIAGWLALAAPALLVIPMLFVLESASGHPRVINAQSTLILATAVLLALSSVPLSANLIDAVKALVH